MAYIGSGFFYVSKELSAGYNIGKEVNEFMKKISTLKALGLYQTSNAGILFTIGTAGVCIDGYPDITGGTTTSDEFSKTIEGNTSAAATLIMKKRVELMPIEETKQQRCFRTSPKRNPTYDPKQLGTPFGQMTRLTCCASLLAAASGDLPQVEAADAMAPNGRGRRRDAARCAAASGNCGDFAAHRGRLHRGVSRTRLRGELHPRQR